MSVLGARETRSGLVGGHRQTGEVRGDDRQEPTFLRRGHPDHRGDWMANGSWFNQQHENNQF